MNVWIINRRSLGYLYIRFFTWLWGVSEESLNFCKLFWGTICAPIGLIFGPRLFNFIPRISIFYTLLGLGFWLLGQLGLTLIWLALAVILSLVSYREYRRKRGVD